MTLNFNRDELWSLPIHKQKLIKVKSQLVQKLDWKQTDGRTQPIASPSSLKVLSDYMYSDMP